MNEVKADTLKLARLKAASEDYKVHKSIFVDPVTDEQLEGFLEWPVFRDQFLSDWTNNRRVVTEKEADVIFDRIADESLSELENIGAVADVSDLAEQVAATEEDQDDTSVIVESTASQAAAVVTETAPVAAKRRGRPPGKPKLEVVVSNDTPAPAKKAKSYYVPVSQRKAAKPAKVAKPKKAAAKKKSAAAPSKAQAIVEKYAARDWSRKDIIEKLVASGVSAGYAPTLYQKFA